MPVECGHQLVHADAQLPSKSWKMAGARPLQAGSLCGDPLVKT